MFIGSLLGCVYACVQGVSWKTFAFLIKGIASSVRGLLLVSSPWIQMVRLDLHQQICYYEAKHREPERRLP
jgi:hypothetical protein